MEVRHDRKTHRRRQVSTEEQDLTAQRDGLAVTADLCRSGQDHCPFDGEQLTGWPVTTVVGGRVHFRDGEIVGEPAGAYVARN
jgi:hypothetical protein